MNEVSAKLQPGHGRSAVRGGHYALAVLTLVYMFNFIDRQILAILLPAIKLEFGVDDTVLGVLAGPAFAIMYAILGVPVALLADRCNRRNLIAVALATWSAMTALSGLAGSVLQLAFARIGVGVGEAGCSPPAHSMIADFFPPQQRSTAMGIFTLGISTGIMVAYLGGGWVAQNIGWREAFFLVGLPGLILAVIVRFTVEEPQRGASEGRGEAESSPGLAAATRFLMKRRSFLHMALGGGVSSFGAYAVLSFFPSFLARSHNMELSDIGLYLGLILGIAGGIGFAGGGYFADRIGRIGPRWSLWGVAAATMLGWIFMLPVYFVDSGPAALALFAVPIVFLNFYLATTFAQTQGLAGLRMRSVASALLLLILNIIGLGLGPLAAGVLSDSLAATAGDESLRYSLLIICAISSPWSALHFLAAGRHIEVDLRRADPS